MKRFIVGGLAVSAILVIAPLSIASAADMAVKAAPPPTVPAWSWTGFYVGGNVGAAWPTNSQFVMNDPTGVLFAPGQTAMIQSDQGNDALMGGFHAGYNYQFSPTWVAGVEADWSFTRLRLASSAPMNFLGVFPSAGTNLSASSDLSHIGSVRGRLGYAGINNWLIYGTGGWAYTHVRDVGAGVCGPPSCGFATSTQNGNVNANVTGWTAGGGAEYRLPITGSAGNWIIGAEYLFYKLNAAESTLGIGGLGFPFPMTWGSFNVQEVRARLSYKF
jgi:outer membrane immunogenic protein